MNKDLKNVVVCFKNFPDETFGVVNGIFGVHRLLPDRIETHKDCSILSKNEILIK